MIQPDADATPDGSPAPATAWAERADEAARSVTHLFGQRLFFLPGTHIAATARPSGRIENLRRPWHYWWQAHYLDCLVDAGFRELGRAGRPPEKFDGGTRPSAGQLASRLVTGIRLRNFLTFVNHYYDDMAWLALSTLRLERLAEESRRPSTRRQERIRKSLTLQFDSASTDDLGGGTFWSTKRDFKNTPATAPVALYYARTGNTAKAQALLDWLDARLFDPTRGLYLDGIRIRSTGETVLEEAIYTYNQGPVLGALLELGGTANLERASTVVRAVAAHLTLPEAGGRKAGNSTGADASPAPSLILRCDGTGDGGLFTGILTRYLALAANDQRLPQDVRATAAGLVTGTAGALWANRRLIAAGEPLARHGLGGDPVFSSEPRRPASDTYPPGAAVELSTQLQAWMALEAAASVTAAPATAGSESGAN
ncbi:glycoside hydrolase family 76 protein [Arthrobacter sp. AFG20]|uniref:glycoside hydrolase family 76 protein n=1 Tax=Arthrobacter sp. AFG20 TaxID=1688671 RepID=UPI000C9E37DB|nr:glycoside hydrolase family 76 protein [Arthrobacter sp. AFG20]PNH83770.1 glycosyl hydrolase [Arthrobacter sp. AFG20]